MRISDWSSDVCSSDLVPVDAAVAGDLRQACRHVDEGVPVAAAGFEQQHPAARVFGQAVGKHAAGGTGTDDDVVVGEIGRASCRERVCQYGWISVVAVSLKKNKQDKKIRQDDKTT